MQLTSSSSNVLEVVGLAFISLSIVSVETVGYSDMVRIKTHLCFTRISQKHFENLL